MCSVDRRFTAALVCALAAFAVACRPARTPVLRAGYGEFRPYLDADANGQPQGFAVDVLNTAARRAGVQLEWIRVFGVADDALDSGRIDIYPVLTVTEERKRKFRVSSPWWENQQALVTRVSRSSASISPIAARNLPPDVSLARKLFPGASITPLRTEDLMPAVCSQTVAAALIDLRFLHKDLLNRPAACEQVALDLQVVPGAQLRLAAASTHAAAKTAQPIFDEIAEMVAKGSISQAAVQWSLFAPGHSELLQSRWKQNELQKITWLTSLAFTVLFLTTLWYVRRVVHARKREIAARQKAEEAEQRFQAFMNHAPVVAFIKDEHGRHVYANKELLNRFGLTPDTCYGKTDHDLWPEAADCFRENDLCILAENQPRQLIDRLADRSGIVRHWLVVKFPFRNASGEQLLGGTAIDVTDQQMASLGLIESEERYRTLFEDAPVAIHEIDANGIIVRVNKAECLLLGYSAEEMIGRPVWEFVAPQQRSLSQRMVRHKIDGSLPLAPFRREYVCSDGTPVTLEIHEGQIADHSGRVVGLRSCLLDLTERLAAQKRLDGYARELQDKNRELAMALNVAQQASLLKDQFLTNVSHEIRTPMNGVLGMTELLLNTSLTAEQQELAGTVLQSGEHLMTIINDILDFSKIEAGRIDLESAPFDMRELVESAVEVLAQTAARKGVEVVCEFAPDTPALLMGDSARLRQILTNFVANAIKFTERGEIVIRVQRLRTETPERASMQISVSDTGIGIAPEVQQRLFTPFTQADSSTTRRFGGTGLGLAISKRLVELMEGSVGVTSELGKGSTFWFSVELPVAESAPGARVDLNDVSILVVDDNDSNRQYLRILLGSWGARVKEADNGFDALSLLRAAPDAFAFALLDFHMPGMDGIELAEHIQADPAISNVRLVLLSSFSDSVHRERAKRAGIETYLTKPIRQIALLRALAPVESVRVEHGATTEHAHRSALPVLVAEDNPINARLAVRLVEQLGYSAELVATGSGAVEAFEKSLYGAILMDCQMPGMDGYEATQKIRLREAGSSRIPIIALTAHAMKGDREKCIQAGMDDYLAKPLRLSDLGATLARWVQPCNGSHPAKNSNGNRAA